MGSLYPICDGNAWGYIDATGSVAIECQYLSAQPFCCGLARVVIPHSKNENGTSAFIDANGNIEIGPGPPKAGYDGYESWNELLEHGATPNWAYGDFANERAIFRDLTMHRGVGYITRSGRLICLGFNDGYDFSNNVAIVFLESKFRKPAFIDSEGNVTVTPDVLWCGHLSEDFAVFSKQIDGRKMFGYLDVEGQAAVDAKFVSASKFSHGIALVRTTSGFGFIDASGSYVVHPTLRDASNCSDGYALAFDSGEGYILNSRGETVSNVDLDVDADLWIEEAEDGMFLVGADVDGEERYGFVDPGGKPIVGLTLKSAYPFRNGLALVSQNEYVRYIDSSGEVIWESKDWKLD